MRKKEYLYGALPIAVYLGIIWLLSILDMPSWLFMILMIVVASAYIIYVSRSEKLDRIKKKIVSKLRDEGYECSIEEEIIIVTKQKRRWQVYVFESGIDNVFTVYFTDLFSVGTPEEIHWVGSDLLVCAANSNFSRVKVTGNEGKYMCQYQSAIKNVDDFMVVYREAWDNIMQTIEWMSNNWDGMVRRYPALKQDDENGKIGFHPVNNEK